MATPEPQNESAKLEAEKRVLGAIMVDNSYYRYLAGRLTLKDFSGPANRIVFARMAELMGTGRPIDPVTLTDELLRTNELESAGGVAYLASLSESLPGAGQIARSFGGDIDIVKRGSTARPCRPATAIPAETERDLLAARRGRAAAARFESCFISYSTKDHFFADQLYRDLRANGVPCWFAEHDLKGGRKLPEQIVEAIGRSDRLLLILSESSITSHWVKIEITNARRKERRDNRRVLFPIRLVSYQALQEWECWDDTDDLATHVREYFIPDFSNWKNHHAYQEAFERLLRDLKAEETKPPSRSV
jgi:hypothetical protein